MLTLTQPDVTLKRKLGEVLVDGEFISELELHRGLAAQRDTNERLGETLVRLGVLSEMELKAVLAAHVELDSHEGGPAGAGVRHRLGDILLKSKRVKPQMLDRALEEQKRTNEKLGEVLVRFGAIAPAELDAILTWQDDAHKNSATAVKLMLGEILVATDVISRKDLEHALKEQRLTKKQIGEVLVDAGLVKPHHITDALKIQSKLFAATLVAIVAAGTLTGCGMTAPGVPGSLDAKGVGAAVGQANGSIVQYPGSSVVTPRSVQSGGMQHSVSQYANGATVIDNTPYVEQNWHDNTCAQAASTLLLNYWGVNVDYQTVVNESNRFNLGTTPQSAMGYLKSKGLHVQPYKNASVDFIKNMIDQGRPAMVVLDYEGAVHWVVVVGYNDSTSRLIIHDSIEGAFSTMKVSTFEQRWQNKTMTGIPVVGGDNYRGLVFDVSR